MSFGQSEQRVDEAYKFIHIYYIHTYIHSICILQVSMRFILNLDVFYSHVHYVELKIESLALIKSIFLRSVHVTDIFLCCCMCVHTYIHTYTYVCVRVNALEFISTKLC